jgi:3-phenylpropionate/cinnamic acid dioxygenase small subunit
LSDLQQLQDERSISRGLSLFARLLDEKRWDDLGEVFAEDLSFSYGDGREQHGISALRQQMRRFLDLCGGTQHLIGSILIDCDGDRALSRAYVQARHQRRDDPVGPIFDSTGEYIDRWERRPEGWRIVRRDAVWFLHHGDRGVLALDGEIRMNGPET